MEEKQTENTQRPSSFLQDVAKSLFIQHSALSGVNADEEGKEDEYDDLSARSRDEDSNKKDLEGKSNIFVWGDNLHGQLSVIEDQALVHDPIAISLSQVGTIK